MRVQCHFCEHEQSGFCEKKASGGKPLKIKTGKRRTCASYSESTVRIVRDFRRRERSRSIARAQQLNRLAARSAMEKALSKEGGNFVAPKETE